MGEDPNYTTARKLVLYKSLSSLVTSIFLSRAGSGDILSSGEHFFIFLFKGEAVGLLKL